MSHPPLTFTQSLAFKAADALVGALPWPAQPPPRVLTDVADQASDLDAALSKALHLPDGRPDPAYKVLGVVLIDFGPSGVSPRPRPRFATRHDTETRAAIGSLGKIGILYAAFQLRADVRAALASLVRSGATAPTLDDVQIELGRYWQAIPALRSLNLRLPLLDQVFAPPVQDEAGAWAIEFNGMDRVGYGVRNDWYTPVNPATNRFDLVQTLEQVHDLEHGSDKALWQQELLSRSFAERLWLTIRWSDNLAATLCMADVSANRLGYVKAVLRESGLGSGNGDDRRDTGFWLRGAYESAIPPAPEAPAQLWEYKSVAKPQPDGTTKEVSTPKSWQYSDAASLARLMIGLQSRTLISAEASENMLGLLRELNPKREDGRLVKDREGDTTTPGMGSPIEHGLPRYPEDAWTKLGISGSILADWALFDYSFARAFGGSRRTFGLVIVNGRGKVTASNIGDFTTKLLTTLDGP